MAANGIQGHDSIPREVANSPLGGRMASLLNYLHEANNLDNLASTGATGGFVAFSSRRDPNLIYHFGRQPSANEGRSYYSQKMTWDNIEASSAAQRGAARDPKIVDGELRLHPVVTQLLDKETLEKLGMKRDG